MIPISLIKSRKSIGSTIVGQINVLTTITVTPKDSTGNLPVTFALPFAPNTLTDSETIVAKIGGTVLPIQIDRKTHHSSEIGLEFTRRDQGDAALRSLSHAVMSATLPTVAQDVPVDIDLYVEAGSDATATSLTFPSRTLEIEVIENSITYTATLAGLSLDGVLPVAGTADIAQWLDGGICREWIVKLPFNDGTSDHPHLTALVCVRHYASGQTRFDCSIENVVTGTARTMYTYDVRVRVDSVLRYTFDSFNHFVYSRWRICLWDTPRAVPHVAFDPDYLIDTKNFPYYDPTIRQALTTPRTDAATFWATNKPDETSTLYAFAPPTTLSFADSSQTSPGSGFVVDVPSYFGPMGIGSSYPYMATTGARYDIGPMPTWSASWLIDQTYDEYRQMLGYAETSGTWPIHFRHETSKIAIDITAESTRVAPTQAVKSETHYSPYSPDVAHQPDYSFLPYLVTGDFYHLEEMQFWASNNALIMNTSYRQGASGLLDRANQVRGVAWGLRNLAHAHLATPDSHPLKSGYGSMILDNINDLTTRYVINESVDYGALCDRWFETSPWQDDYVTWMASHLVDIGYPSMQAFATYKGIYPTKRLAGGAEYCYQLAAPYRMFAQPRSEIPISEDPGVETVGITHPDYTYTVIKKLSDVYAVSNSATNGGLAGAFTASFPCGTQDLADELSVSLGGINGASHLTTGYCSQLGTAMAAAVDGGTPGAAASWANFLARPEKPDYKTNPQWAIVPRP